MHPLNFSLHSRLATKRLLLHFPNANDAEAVFGLRSNAIINKYITRNVPENIEDAEAFISMILDNMKCHKNLYWLITLIDTKDIIGSIGYHNFSSDYTYGEIGYELHPDFHKKGYMSEALEEVITLGFHKLKLKTIEAFTHKNNESSKSLLIKNKFVYLPERVDEGFENNTIFQLKLSESKNTW